MGKTDWVGVAPRQTDGTPRPNPGGFSPFSWPGSELILNLGEGRGEGNGRLEGDGGLSYPLGQVGAEREGGRVSAGGRPAEMLGAGPAEPRAGDLVQGPSGRG